MFMWDLINQAIGKIKANYGHQSHRPFFMYLALPVAHAPVQVTQPFINAYAGVYDRGWDAIRKARFLRQKRIGVIPKDAALPARNPGDPPWDGLTPLQKHVYSRFMQAYAGYITYGDQQLGRLFNYLRQTGFAKNTLILVLSDNGPASEAERGGFYTPYDDRTTLAEMSAHLNQLGGLGTEPLYPRAWAMASATPYRRYKLWPYLGGVRDDLIVSWPGHIRESGSIRRQYVHAIDVAPTLLAAAGTHFEQVVAGVRQIPVSGKSFLGSFANPNAPSARRVQYFELLGNRAITDGKWRAVAMHEPGTSFSKDRWELFHLTDDPTEAVDLAKQDPVKLRHMQALWKAQAMKYGGWPLAESPFGIWAETQFFTAFPSKDRYDY
jgi:arylsulfatase